MLAFLVSIFLYLAPVFILFYMAIEIYKRNTLSRVNKLASILLLSMMFIMLGNFITNLFPDFIAGQLSLILIYAPSFVLMGSAVHFCYCLTDRFHSIPRAAALLICYAPSLPVLLLLYPFPWISITFVQEGYWKYEYPSTGLLALTMVCAVYTVTACISLTIANLKYVSRLAQNLKKKQIRILLLAHTLGGLWAVPFSFYKRPDIIPAEISMPSVGMFGTLIFALLMRYAMIKYDFLPSKERKYQMLYEMSPMSILLIDNDGVIKDANPEAAILFGFTQEQLLERKLNEFLDAETSLLLKGNCTVVTGTGETKYVKAESEYIVTSGELFQYVVLADVTETRAAEERVSFLAYHDSLTGLANRIRFQQQLEAETSQFAGASFALMLLDLDRFKQINDRQGRFLGDLLLKHVAEQLTQSAPANALIARLSGDEFALLVPGMSKDAAAAAGRKILEGFALPFVHQEQTYCATASLGICLYPEHGNNPDDLLQAADIAMNHGKKHGRNRFVIYDPSLHSEEQQRARVDAEIRQGLEQGEFVLYYQPQTDMKTGQTIGAEALIRWVKPQVGVVPPDEFIPLAEDTGIIVDIGYWVLDTACRQLQTWILSGMPPVCISINLSARQFLDPRFPKQLLQTLERTAIDPGLLCLEITERTAMSDEEYSLQVCRDIMNLGVKLSIDDFGTGYSSLALLKNLSVQSIKIDRSFVKDMVADENDRTIINAIIAMSHSLGKRVVAEGVEERSQWDMLSAMDCDDVQGYYVSRPLSARDFYEFCHKVTC
ncbi:MAG: hypothetical protein K0S39_819 [Paenibacillus sp.]|jgi:diguanylate cyclase (GGDEF)-like protein/PAS domain S-box-containing protein|nr:hypothetical protein [Paenibacillus sp.]